MSEKTDKLEAELEKLRASKAKAEETQYEADLEARLELEQEHEAIAAVKVARFISGQPTQAYVRTPSSAEYRRFRTLVHKAVGQKNPSAQAEASEQLARSCWVYPKTDEGRNAMLAAFPGILTPLANAAAALAQGNAEDVGKD